MGDFNIGDAVEIVEDYTSPEGYVVKKGEKYIIEDLWADRGDVHPLCLCNPQNGNYREAPGRMCKKIGKTGLKFNDFLPFWIGAAKGKL